MLDGAESAAASGSMKLGAAEGWAVSSAASHCAWV
jgi:hypothetical protein